MAIVMLRDDGFFIREEAMKVMKNGWVLIYRVAKKPQK